MSVCKSCLVIWLFIVSVPAFGALEQLQQDISLGHHQGITGMMVSVQGQQRALAYAPGYSAEQLHDVRSVTKSITALLLGIALQQNKLDVQLPVYPFLPQQADKQQLKLLHLLTMQSGVACNDWQPASAGHEDKMYQSDDWLAFWLRLPMSHDIGRQFSYCTGNVIALGPVLRQLSGLSITEFAAKELFSPMQITSARWSLMPDGKEDTGGHLMLRLADMHKIGELVLQQGVWQGKQLLPSHWIQQMLTAYSKPDDRAEQYGYLWWRMQHQALPTIYYAHGNGGNFIFVVPKLALVVSFTGTNYNSKKQFLPMKLLVEHIIPGVL